MSSIHTPTGQGRIPRRARSGAKRTASSWRSRLLAGGLVFGLAGLQLGASPAQAAGGDYLLMSRDRLMSLPTSGEPWRRLVRVATSGWTAPELDDQDNKTNVQALAAALVYARTGDGAMRAKARNALEAMIPTYNLSQDAGLGPARQIAGWVLTADFIGLDGGLDGAFRDMLRRALAQPIGGHVRWGKSLRECHEDSDNNWGAWCGASRIAAVRYLGDATELERAERVHRGFLGDRTAWSSFRGQGASNGILDGAIRTWSCDASPESYVPTNPACGDRGGAFPADAARSGAYSQLDAAYQSETTAGVVLSTELLFQGGFARAWTFRDALARVAAFDYRHGAWNLGSVQYHWPWLINKRLGTSYPTVDAGYGRSLGYTDWLYGSGGGSNEPPSEPDPTPDPTPDPVPDATPSPTPKGKGNHGKKPTASPASVAPAGELIDPTATSGTISTSGSTSGEAEGPGSVGGQKDGAAAKADAKGKPPRDSAKHDRKKPATSNVTYDARTASPTTELVAAAIVAGLLVVVLLQSRRRPDPA